MTPVETVAAYVKAVDRKDLATARGLLQRNFRFQGPMMTAESADAFFDMMGAMPLEATMKTDKLVADGDSVVHIYTFEITAPVAASVPMCECFELKGGKIASSRLFFDTAKFPRAGG